MAALITGIEPIFDFDNPNYFVVKMPFQGAGVNGTYTLTGNSGSQGAVNWTGNIVDTEYDVGLGGYKITPIEFTPVFRVFGATGVDAGSGTFEAKFPASNPYKVSWQYDAGGFVGTGATVPQGAAITIGPCVGDKAQVYIYSEPKSPDHFDQVITGQMTLTDTTNSIPYGTGTVVIAEAGAPTYGSVWDLGLQDTGTINFMVQGNGGAGDTFTLPANITCTPSTCPLVTAGAVLPDGTSGVAYTHTMTIDGDVPITLSSIVKPAWMTISITGNTVTFSGTPAAGDLATGISIGFTATNTCGDISFTDTINVVLGCTAPAITTQPVSATVCSPATNAFTVVATGTAPLTYQWSNAGGVMAGETAATLTTGVAGTYTVAVTNACGTVTSSAATLTVNTPVSITSGATLPDATSGVAYNHSVVYAGTIPLAITSIIKPAWATVTLTGNTVTITGTPTAGDVATGVAFSWDISNSCNTLPFSDTINVTAGCVPPVITLQPTGGDLCFGEEVTLMANATGTATLNFLWKRNGVNIVQVNSNTHATSLAGTYTVTVSNACGTVVSADAVITIINSPAITSGGTLPDGTVGVAYNHSVVYSGATPMTISNIIKPAWATVTLTGTTVTITGTPAIGDVTASAAFSWDITNACNVLPFSDTIAITNAPTCVAVTGGTINGVNSSNSGATETYNVTGLSGDTPYTYTWTVANGTILSGQGTSSITVLWD